MKKILKNILIISFNIIIIIYLTELLALLFFPSKTDSYIDIDYLRNGNLITDNTFIIF